jgi:hypothetical protein
LRSKPLPVASIWWAIGLPLAEASRIVPRPGERGLFLGRHADGFRIDADLPLPVDPRARTAVLQGPAAADAITRWQVAGCTRFYPVQAIQTCASRGATVIGPPQTGASRPSSSARIASSAGP